MWIEIVGLPGVGKTALLDSNVEAIAKNYKVLRSDRESLRQKLVSRLLFSLKYRFFFEDRVARKLAYRHGFRFFENCNENIFFYDSGMLQVVLESLIENNFSNEETLLAHMHRLPLSQTVIFLKDDAPAVAQREFFRNPRRFDFSLEETIKRYTQAHEFLEKKLLLRIRRVEVLENMSGVNARFAEILR